MPDQDFNSTPRSAAIRYGNVTDQATSSWQPAPAESLVADLALPVEGPAPVAILVCHGMGQQVRFETIGQIAASLLKEAAIQGCTATESVVELSNQNDSFLARAQLSWTTPAGDRHSVHIYEAYWAPVTEGQVTYWDTVTFLFAAAWKGYQSSRFFRQSDYERYIFGRIRKLPIFPNTKLGLLAVTFYTILQVIIGLLATATLADTIKQITSISSLRSDWSLISSALHFPWSHISALLNFAVCVWLVAVFYMFRYFIIQYVGDVAAYISPYKDSKFEEIRNKIQAIGLTVARVIYGFGNTTIVPNYQRVVFVGHSLGSVLAYDTLNAIINLDLTSATPGSQRVLERTTKLITFGSPLDKTAFLFRNQSNHVKDPLREQMASAFQPLILDYETFRKPHFWTNLWSPLDIISGSLEYYDVPALTPDSTLDPNEPLGTSYPGNKNDPRRVENLRDPAGTIPLIAHVQYWSGRLLAETLYAAVK